MYGVDVALVVLLVSCDVSSHTFGYTSAPLIHFCLFSCFYFVLFFPVILLSYQDYEPEIK